jgi:hypothetical protein
MGSQPTTRLKTRIGFANIVQESEHRKARDISVVEVALRRGLHGTTDRGTSRQGGKTSGHIEHVIDQGMSS